MLDLNKILYTVYRNPLLQNINKADIVDDVKAVVELLGIPATFKTETIKLKIINFRANLPSDLHSIIAVNTLKVPGTLPTRLRTSADDRILNKRNETVHTEPNFTYKQVPGFIYTDFEKGLIEVTYKGYMVDENGFPVLPNSQSLLQAIVNYIKVNYFTMLVENNLLANATLEKAEQQYNWYAGQASNEFATPSEEEAESLVSALARLIPDRNAFMTNFKYNSNTEVLNKNL